MKRYKLGVEYEIGELLSWNKSIIEVIKDPTDNCNECVFNGTFNCAERSCTISNRKDKGYIKYVKLPSIKDINKELDECSKVFNSIQQKTLDTITKLFLNLNVDAIEFTMKGYNRIIGLKLSYGLIHIVQDFVSEYPYLLSEADFSASKFILENLEIKNFKIKK